MRNKNQLLVFLTLITFLAACTCGKKKGNNAITDYGKNELAVHELSDADKLNPTNSTDAGAVYIEDMLFMQLLDVDKKTMQIVPELAVARPTVTEITDGEFKGGLAITFEIRNDAKWDNGTPVLASDFDFTYKTLLHPLLDNEQGRSTLDFLKAIAIDPTNNRKFTLYTNQKHYLSEFITGSVFVLPEYIYDPTHALKNTALSYITNPKNTEAIKASQQQQDFAKEFNSDKFQREKGFVVGCGPYQFESWATTQRIVLTKKKGWWGDIAKIPAYPDKITYEIINDWSSVNSSIKNKSLDVVRAMKPKDFITNREDKELTDIYKFETPEELSYVYIGINLKDARLSDIKVREALAHCVDIDDIIKSLLYGLADPMNGPVQVAKKYYDKTMKPFAFDVELAKKILDEDGWKDTDGDGVRDKIINGIKQSLSFTIKFNQGNDTREKICLLFGENAKKVGIQINTQPKEWTVFIDETKKHNFDLYVGGWVGDPINDDPKQIWHTSSTNGGSNYVSFGNQESDLLIDKLRVELDEAKREILFKQFQNVVHDNIPYIFLYQPKNRLVISKRFDAGIYAARPGYLESEFKLKGKQNTAE